MAFNCIIVYTRLYLSSWLPEYDKVIFSDVDVLFTGDMTEVYNVDMEGYEWAGVAAEKNDPNMIMHKYYPENAHEYMYWAGFMVMNLKLMREIGWVKKCNDNIEKYKDRLQMCDLEILNLTAKKIRGLPFRYVCLQSIYQNDDIAVASEFDWLNRIYSKDYLEKEKETVKIIHYAGNYGIIGKPWLRFNPPDNYNRYLKSLPPAESTEFKNDYLEKFENSDCCICN